MSLALNSEQEEKKVLLRVLQACEKTEVAVKRVSYSFKLPHLSKMLISHSRYTKRTILNILVQVSLHADTIQGSCHLALASFIAQMLPGVDPKVVESACQ